MRIVPGVVAAVSFALTAALTGCAGVAGATPTPTTSAPSASPTPLPSASSSGEPAPAATPAPTAPAPSEPSPSAPSPGAPEATPDAADAAETRTFLVRDWQRVDGTMDNTADLAWVDGDRVVATTADGVRDAGWRAVHAHPAAGLGAVGWPPDDAELTVRLDAATWAFVIAELERWGEVARGLLARSTPADAAQWREDLRWHTGMVAALRSGSAAPRSGA